MTTGVLAQAALAATTNTLLYTAVRPTACTINLVNIAATAATVRIAIGTIPTPSNPANSNYIEFDASIPARGVLERSGILLDTGQRVVVFGSAANITATIYGID